MAYTIVKSDGTVLTSIADGTINTTSTSVGLPGRNYAGYGQTLDTNFVHQIESYAATTPPANPLRGQLWYNINANTLYVCPADGATASSWLALTSTSSGGATTFGGVTVTGNVQANNLTAVNIVQSATGVFTDITVSANANIYTANVTSGIVGTLLTTLVTTGATSSPGSMVGTWTVSGTASGNALIVDSGNVYATTGIKCDNYMWANGVTFNTVGSYSNANVTAYLPTYTGTLQPSSLTTSAIAGGGTVGGIWTLLPGATFQASTAFAVAGANVSGTVANATYAVTAGSANAVAGANVTGTVSNATNAVIASSANAVAGANVSGTVAFATYATSAGTAGTVTTAAQPNITSIGAMSQLTTTSITTGAVGTGGSLTGNWTLTSGSQFNATYATTAGTVTSPSQPNITSVGTLSSLTVTANVSPGGIKTDNYYYANGVAISFAGVYSNSNVASYLPTFTGTVGATTLTTGASSTPGTITGNWTLSSGSRLNATYADLAERFEADAEYDAGTVVELGGENEVTSVVDDLSENVFGVVSTTAAYLMNSGAGSDKTHPAIAMSGRVQVKVSGSVKKGDRLVSAGRGKARAAQLGEATAFNTIGRSLVNKNDEGTGTVEAIVTIK